MGITRLLVLTAIVAVVAGLVGVASAQTPTTDTPTPFRFELEQANGPRGLAVEGYVYNDLPWRITNVRLRVDGVNDDGAVSSSSSGWVVGDVRSGGRAYFYVAVPSPAKAYRATVQSFDKVAVEPPRVEAP